MLHSQNSIWGELYTSFHKKINIKNPWQQTYTTKSKLIWLQLKIEVFFKTKPNPSLFRKTLKQGLTVNIAPKRPWWKLISNCSSYFESFWLVGFIPPAPSQKHQFCACDNSTYTGSVQTAWSRRKHFALLEEFLTNTKPQKKSCMVTAHAAQQRWEFCFQRSLLFHFIMTTLTTRIFRAPHIYKTLLKKVFIHRCVKNPHGKISKLQRNCFIPANTWTQAWHWKCIKAHYCSSATWHPAFCPLLMKYCPLLMKYLTVFQQSRVSFYKGASQS